MRQTLTALLTVVALPTAAQDWRVLEEGEIRETLLGQTVDYAAAWQDFRANGRTLYNAGADSWGAWDVQNGQYCSQWPPNSAWSCYSVDLNADGSAVRFRGEGNDVSIGRFRDAE
ncbi:MAG: hypothetical protein ACR2O1_04660 [Boseongicola sp.]